MKSNKEECVDELEFLRQRVAELEETEDRYRTLIELGAKIGEAVIMLQDIGGKEGVHTYVSDLWPQITGYSRKELLKMSFFELVKPDDHRLSIKRHRQKMSGESIPDLFELSIIRKDSKEVPVEVTSAVTIYKGEPTNVVYIRDITERKLLEKQIAGDKKSFEDLFSHSPFALWELDYSSIKKLFDKLHVNTLKNIIDYNELFDAHDKVIMTRYNQAAMDLYETDSKHDYEYYMPPLVRNVSINSKTFKTFSKNMNELYKGASYYENEGEITSLKGNRKNIRCKFTIPPGYEDTWSKVFVSVVDITELKQKEKRLKASESRLKLLSRQVLTTQEEERLNISRELHDQLGQEMVSIRLNAIGLANELVDHHTYQQALKLAEMTANLIGTIQQVSMKLRPLTLDILNPVEAIREYIENLTQCTQLPCKINILDNNLKDIKLSENNLNMTFRIVQEALNNAIKHSNASNVNVVFSKTKGELSVVIEDNGIGMDTSGLKGKTSIGIIGMQERAMIAGGNLKITSKPQKGTKIILRLPCEAKNSQQRK